MDAVHTPADQRLEMLLGRLLRAGVSTAAALVAAGAVWYLVRHGREFPVYGSFHPFDANRPGAAAVIEGIRAGRSRSLIQAGLLVLIATPVARVIFSLAAFALERDWIYVGVTAVVLSVLLFSLLAA